jgi:hypothetical protein
MQEQHGCLPAVGNSEGRGLGGYRKRFVRDVMGRCLIQYVYLRKV